MYLKDFYLFKMDVEALKTPFQTILNKESWIEMRLSAKAIENGEKHIPKEIIQIAYPESKRFDEFERVLKYEQKIQADNKMHAYLHNETRTQTVFDLFFVFGLIIIVSIFVLKKYKGFIEKLKTNLEEANQTKSETPKTKICPRCSEEILYTAKKCRYCQSNLYQFTFLKNPKFNFAIWCFLLTFVIILALFLTYRYFYPICLYTIFLFKSILDPIIIMILIFTLGLSVKKPLWNTLLAIIIILSIYGCINGYREYVANVFSISRIATMLIFALVVLAYICQKLQKKCSATIGFLCLWVVISFIIRSVTIDTTIPAELDTTDNANYIKVTEYDEKNLDLPDYAWKSITYVNEKWQFEEYNDSIENELAICGTKGCHDVKNFAEAQEATGWYTQDEIEFILNHDMLDEKNENEFNVKFRGGATLELPAYQAFGCLYVSRPNYMTVPNLIGIDKKLAVVYSYNSSCDLTNCAWLNIEILKADEDGKIKNIFQKSYNQNNNGSYEITPYHNSYGDNLTMKIEGKNKLIVLMYSGYDRKIREYILEPKPSESIEYITAKQQKTIQ